MDRAAGRHWLATGLLMICGILAMPIVAQDDAVDVHTMERELFGFGELRRGASGNSEDENAANSIEANVGEYTVPPLFEHAMQQTTGGWPSRRAELARMVEDNWVGRIPAVVESFEIEWERVPLIAASVTQYYDLARMEEWTGVIITPDGRRGPTISARLYIPKVDRPTPALINYTYMWPGGVTPNFGGPPPPDSIMQALENGWSYIAYHPQMLQADNSVEMQDGIIGLARWPRQQYDWGALRAWAWGASQLREQLATDPRINGNRIALTGHSRFGKGTLVAAAFDHAFHDAHISSSGAGGAKLMRRDFGERWENMSGDGAFHWFTPNIMNYAREGRSVHDLPIDAHSLIALRAPRPLFITSGMADKGDSWVDPAGMWTAAMLAQPAWDMHGLPTPRGGMPVSESREQMAYPLGWYQHGEGHVPWPAYDEFYEHAERFFVD